MSNAIACPSPGVLKAMVEGRASEQELIELGDHLEQCEACRDRFDQFAVSRDATLPQRPLQRVDSPELQRVRQKLERTSFAPPPVQASYATSAGTGGLPPAELPSNLLQPSGDPALLGLLNGYEVIETIGSGGMGVVLKGRDPKLNRIVAIKVLAPHLAANGAARQRFFREAQAAAAVVHEHVVTIHAVEEAAGVPLLVMQYIPGLSLRQKIDQTGPLELRRILRIALQTAAGLAAAHAQGLIHRDIKPANILLENGVERVRITDFGLATAADDVALTQTGYLAGTPQYMSPEQAQGKPLDARSDLFSLGSVMYEMCTGRAAFRSSNPYAAIQRVCHEEPRSIRQLNPDIPEWMCQIVERLLAKDPKARFASAADLVTELQRRLTALQSPSEGREEVVPATHAATEVVPHSQPILSANAPSSVAMPPQRPPNGRSTGSTLTPAGQVMLLIGLMGLALSTMFCVGSVVLALAGLLSANVPAFAGVGAMILFLGALVSVVAALTTQRQSEPPGHDMPEKLMPGRAATPSEIDDACKSVSLPSLGLIAVAAINIAITVSVIIALQPMRGPGLSLSGMIVLLSSGVLGLLIGAGGLAMRRLQSYPLAWLAAGYAMLPLHFAFPLGLIAGIWSLVILSSASTRRAFAATSQGWTDANTPRPRLSAGGLAFVITGVVVPLFLLSMLVVIALSGSERRSQLAILGTPTPRTDHWEVTPPTPEIIQPIQWTEEGPRLGVWLASSLHLSQGQTDQINEALRKVRHEYLAIEKKHTEYKENELGHLVVTVKPFSRELTELEDKFWTEVDAAVPEEHRQWTLRSQISLRGEIMPHGSGEKSLEIWRIGTWFHFRRTGVGLVGLSQDAARLPRDMEHLWVPPEERPGRLRDSVTETAPEAETTRK
jgi:serine/threonine protein kinase